MRVDVSDDVSDDARVHTGDGAGDVDAFEIVRGGASTTAQGGPVRGRAHRGWSIGGAADFRSLALANRAIGNAPDARGYEVVLSGPTLTARADVVVCVAGAPFPVFVDDAAAPMWTPLAVRAGSTLRIGTCAAGLRCAVAVRATIGDAPGDANSRVHLHGDAKGATRPDAHAAAHAAAHGAPIDSALRPAFDVVTRVRVVDSAQAARFDPSWTAGTFTVGRASDRRGVRLESPPDVAARWRTAVGELVTEGAPYGAVQVTPSGHAIVLGVDQCTTGGYAKIAAVIGVDLWRIGQLRPGHAVTFERTTYAHARDLWRAWCADLESAP